jgi:hypothetical protein
MVLRFPRRRHTYATSARFLASRAVLVVAALTILLGVLRGGSRFFYCPVMHLAFDAPCCAPDREPTDERDAHGPAVDRADCCQEKHQRAMPATSVPSASHADVPPAGCMSVVRGADLGAGKATPVDALAHNHPVRAGPSPPSARERRAALMVFHI